MFDFVVSSYTPTVSALLQALSHPSGLEHPKIMAVAQSTSETHSALPNTKQELETLRHIAGEAGVDIVALEDESGTVDSVLHEMQHCNWVHLACHGTQELEHPTKSAFILADGNLELAEIIKTPLPHAEFAFLSACQTASGDPKLAEEAVHLAAGMLLAGYRGVIATMWAILDKDGPVVSDVVYAEMLRDGKADHTRAAYALHKAVQKLRLSGAPFMAWMPFIHMGM